MSEIESIRREDFNTDLAWLAGFIDGEGNINVGFYSNGMGDWKVFRISVSMCNTHAYAIKKATEVLKSMDCFFTISIAKKDTKWRPCLSILVQGQKNAYKLLKHILPYLTCKREVAQQAIYAYEYRQTLRRAGNNQFTVDRFDRVQDDKILLAMCERARELVKFRPDVFKYSRLASEPICIKRPSETTRLAALSADDIVRAA